MDKVIKDWNELSEALAQFENRVSFLENRMPYSSEPKAPNEVSKDPEWVSKQWDAVQQLRAMVLHLQGKLNKHIDKKRGKEAPF